MDMEIIRKAVTKHHGGFEKASDAQIMIIWNSLDEQTQQAYLKKVTPPQRLAGKPHGASKERKGKDAFSSGTKSKV